MSHRKLQKEVEAVFKKINEGIDLFNYYYVRHEDSSNDSQRDKLEADLKKEIKRLQKFRDQIKTWQLNDSIEAAVQPNKLQEHRRMVEEAMEKYKDVEKSLKMKLYSNQLILLAALELENGLSHETIEAIEFVEEAIEKVQEQIEYLEQEYEKLSQKKVSKKASSETEERKQEIDSFINRDNFHVSKLEHISMFLKKRRIEGSLVNMIKDDITFYIESNQEPDFIDDDTLYDEIFKEAAKSTAANVESHQQDTSMNTSGVFNELNDIQEGDLSFNENVHKNIAITDSGTASPLPNSHSLLSNVNSNLNNSSTATSLQSAASSASPYRSHYSINTKQLPAPESPEILHPGIIKTLKPATIPLKPGNLKWSAAAAGNGIKKDNQEIKSNITEQEKQLGSQGSVKEQNTQSHTQLQIQSSSNTSFSSKTALDASMDSGNEEMPFETAIKSIIQNSNLPTAETILFTDFNVARVPCGIQDFILGYNASKVAVEDKNSSLLVQDKGLNAFLPLTSKPYLPGVLRNSFYPTFRDTFSVPLQHQLTNNLNLKQNHNIRPPLNLVRFQLYWNNIRATNSFQSFISKVQALQSQNTHESMNLANELTMVLFYGYYYGCVPIENEIAEFYLFQLGWKPYKNKIHASGEIKLGSVSSSPSSSGNKEVLEMVGNKNDTSREFLHWFKEIKIDSKTQQLGLTVEYGDYSVFDLLGWDIYLKTNFKFEYKLSNESPLRSIYNNNAL